MAGRPKLTTGSFPKQWKREILDKYKQGAADIEIYAGYLGICHETFTRLLNEDSIFSETIKNGRALSEAWWIENGRTNLKDRDFNYTGWYMNMKNRFKWADRQDINNTHTFTQMGVVKKNGVSLALNVGAPPDAGITGDSEYTG